MLNLLIKIIAKSIEEKATIKTIWAEGNGMLDTKGLYVPAHLLHAGLIEANAGQFRIGYTKCSIEIKFEGETIEFKRLDLDFNDGKAKNISEYIAQKIYEDAIWETNPKFLATVTGIMERRQ